MSDVPQRVDDTPPECLSEHGAIARALVWVGLGVLVAVALFVVVSPELVNSAPDVALELLGVVSLAAVPGLVLLVMAAVRRKRLGLDDVDDEPDLVDDRSRRGPAGPGSDTQRGR